MHPIAPIASESAAGGTRAISPTDAATGISLGAVLAVTLAGVTAPETMTAAGPAVLAAGVLLGLPHGAVDHLVPAWLGLAALRRRGIAAVVAGYIATAALAWAALSLGGPWGLLALMVVSVLHFGLGDVIAVAERSAVPAPTGGALAAEVLARGGPPLILPLACWPAALDPALDAFDPAVTALLSSDVRLMLLVTLAVCCGVTASRAWRAGRPLEVAELSVLVALFLTTPPLCAFGVYFGLWHSLRHVARLLEADPHNVPDLLAGRWWPQLRRFMVAATVPTLGALVALAVLILAAAQTPLLVPMLSILLALTVPHVAFVAMMDTASGCWSTSRRARRAPATPTQRTRS